VGSLGESGVPSENLCQPDIKISTVLDGAMPQKV
jgi:hypothetical protein